MPRKIVIQLIVGMIFISFCNTVFSIYYRYIQNSTYIQSFFVLFLFISVFIILLSKNKFNGLVIRLNFLDLSFILLSFNFTIQFFISSDYNILFDRLFLLISFSIFYLILAATLDNSNQKSILSIFYTLSIIGSLQIVYSIFQFFNVFPTLFDFKFGGTFGNPGDLANFLALTYSVTLGFLFIEKEKKATIILRAILLFHLFLIVISGARTAWIAVFCSTLYLLHQNYNIKSFLKKIKTNINLPNWSLLIISLTLVCLLCFASWKIYEFKSASANGRLFIWQLCLQLIAEKPLFGHGYESFITVLRLAQINYFTVHPDDIKNGMLAANSVFAFNDFLQFMVEYGIVGGFLLVSLFLLPFRKFKAVNETDKKVINTIRGTIIALFICALFSYPLQNQTIILIFIILLAIINTYDQTALLQFRVSAKLRMPIISIIIVGCLCLIKFNYNKIVNGLKWKQAYDLLQSKPQQGVEIYSSIYEFLKHDRSFISNYGESFYRNGEYQKLVDYYEKYGYFNPSSDILLMIGESYEKLGNRDKAEEYYQKASYLIPHLFVPRFRLYKLYLKNEENDKAMAEAQAISNLQIKIYSDIVKSIKTEVNEYLFNAKKQKEYQPLSTNHE